MRLGWTVLVDGERTPVPCQPHVVIDGTETYLGPPMPPLSADATFGSSWILLNRVGAFGPTNETSQIVLDSAEFQAVTASGRRASGQVSIDCGSVGTGAWTGTVAVLPQPPAGREPGVSINDGADFTNAADVRVFLGWEGAVDKVKVSNDGGFAPSKTREFDVVGTDPLPWTLVELANERIPRQVYVKFHRVNSPTWSSTYTDDILLDTIRPAVTTASVSGGAALRISPAKGLRSLRVAAKDNRSGIASMQVSTGRPNRHVVIRPFARKTPVRGAGRVFVRVRDGAGNWSTWRSAS